MKILAILGSPHGHEGATYELLSHVLKSCEKEGAKTEVIVLSKHNIQYCSGCGNCLTVGDCSIKDDVPKIHDKIREADGVIFASPVYLGTITGQMKVFFDRSLPIGHRPLMPGKYGLAVIVSAGIMDEPTMNYLEGALTSFGIPSVGGICGIAVSPGMFEQEEIVFKHAQRLGKRLVTAFKEKHHYPETGENVRARNFFRDLFIKYQGLFKEDYEYYKERGWLDLPKGAAEEDAERAGIEISNEEVKAAIARVRDMFENMASTFKPEKAKKLNATYQFELHEGDEKFVWHLTVKDQKCHSAEGPHEKPSIIMRCSALDWIAIAEGKLGGTKAYLTGRLKTEGRMRLLTKLEKVFVADE